MPPAPGVAYTTGACCHAGMQAAAVAVLRSYQIALPQVNVHGEACMHVDACMLDGALPHSLLTGGFPCPRRAGTTCAWRRATSRAPSCWWTCRTTTTPWTSGPWAACLPVRARSPLTAPLTQEPLVALITLLHAGQRACIAP